MAIALEEINDRAFHTLPTHRHLGEGIKCLICPPLKRIEYSKWISKSPARFHSASGIHSHMENFRRQIKK